MLRKALSVMPGLGHPRLPYFEAKTRMAGSSPAMTKSKIENQSCRVLQHVLHAHQERHRLAAVDDAVVVGERQIHHRPDFDLAGERDRALLDLVMPRMPDCGALRIGVDISEP